MCEILHFHRPWKVLGLSSHTDSHLPPPLKQILRQQQQQQQMLMTSMFLYALRGHHWTQQRQPCMHLYQHDICHYVPAMSCPLAIYSGPNWPICKRIKGYIQIRHQNETCGRILTSPWMLRNRFESHYMLQQERFQNRLQCENS